VVISASPAPLDRTGARTTDHEFPALPSVGQQISFTDHLNGDYIVERVGFVQERHGFVACVWIGPIDVRAGVQASEDDLHAENDRGYG
jgi:hypothetical protein